MKYIVIAAGIMSIPFVSAHAEAQSVRAEILEACKEMTVQTSLPYEYFEGKLIELSQQEEQIDCVNAETQQKTTCNIKFYAGGFERTEDKQRMIIPISPMNEEDDKLLETLQKGKTYGMCVIYNKQVFESEGRKDYSANHIPSIKEIK